MKKTRRNTEVQVYNIQPVSHQELVQDEDSKLYSKKSVAFFDSSTSASYPSLTITGNSVSVSWVVTGGGQIRHSVLQGSGGTYFLLTGVTNNINPGTYAHTIDGVIVNTGNGGYIESTISYD